MATGAGGATAPRLVPDARPRCADFLSEMGRKPPHLAYVGCRYLPERQGKPMDATYAVSGRFAAGTEALLVKTVGLNRLRRSCCQWDARGHSFKDARGREFSITMTSVETPVAHRAGWATIPRFEIVVETLTEDV